MSVVVVHHAQLKVTPSGQELDDIQRMDMLAMSVDLGKE